MFTEAKPAVSPREARRVERMRAERRWRRAKRLPKLCGILVLVAIAVLAALPFFRLGPIAPVVAGLITLAVVLAMMMTNLKHRAAFMAVQKSRGLSEEAAKRAYVYERPFATA